MVHADAVPIVELRAVEMPTRFGKKSKPVFKIVAWRTANFNAGTAPAPVERVVEAQAAKTQALEDELDDDIQF